MRIVGGQFRGRPLAGPNTHGKSARPPTACANRCSTFSCMPMAIRSPARACSTCSPAPARSGSKRLSRGAAFALFVDDGAEARALIRQNVETLGAAGVTRIFRRDATKLGDGASDRAVLARLSRSALWQGPRREGAGLRARGRLAHAGCADRGRGSARPRSPRRKASRKSSGATTTIRRFVFLQTRLTLIAARTAVRYRVSFSST